MQNWQSLFKCCPALVLFFGIISNSSCHEDLAALVALVATFCRRRTQRTQSIVYPGSTRNSSCSLSMGSPFGWDTVSCMHLELWEVSMELFFHVYPTSPCTTINKVKPYCSTINRMKIAAKVKPYQIKSRKWLSHPKKKVLKPERNFLKEQWDKNRSVGNFSREGSLNGLGK